jgi:hypothetical protein
MAGGVDARSETAAAPVVPLGEQASPLVVVVQTIVDEPAVVARRRAR